MIARSASKSALVAAPMKAQSNSVLKQWVTRHPVLAYLILAYTVSWLIFLVPLLSRAGLGVFSYHVPPVEVFILAVSVIGLAGSAFAVTAVVDGRAGIKTLASRLVRWRVGVQWYLLTLFSLLLVALIGVTVVFGVGVLRALPQHWSLVLTAYLPMTLLVAALVNVWEETGWTGFMFTRLQPRYGAMVASLLVAPCFGGIHLPLFFVTDGLTTGRFPLSQFPLIMFYLLVLFSLPVRVIASWLYNNTKGSTLIVGLLHGALGATAGGTILPYLVPQHAQLLWPAYGAIGVYALLVVIVTRGRLSYRQAGARPHPVTTPATETTEVSTSHVPVVGP